MKSVFITRDLAEDSIFRRQLTAHGFAVEGKSLIEFSAVPFGDPPKADWIFFYSGKGICFFFDNFPKQYFVYSRIPYKIATLGRGTAQSLAAYNHTPDFIGNGRPKETALQFWKIAAQQSILFPRAKYSKQSVQKELLGKIKNIDLVVYKNKPNINCHMKSQDLLVFTSPLNVEAYFHRHMKLPHQRIVAIGETTAAALRKRGFNELAIPHRASEAALAQTVIQLAS